MASAAGSLAACSGSSATTGVPPVTGIIVRAETLTGGRGCGTRPTQLFKYGVIVHGYTWTDRDAAGPDPADPKSYATPRAAGVFDCFADGTFVELPDEGGNTTYRLDVFAFNQPDYAAANGALEAAGTDAQRALEAKPTWTTECFATQQKDVQALAVCAPLVAREGEPTAPVDAGLDGGDVDGGDGGALDAGDAGDGGLLDAGLPETGAIPLHAP